MVVAKVVPSKGVVDYAVEVAKRPVEQVGCEKAMLRSDSEPAVLALKEAVRRRPTRR